MLVNFIVNNFAISDTAASVVFIIGLLLCMAVPYLLGSLNFAIIISKLFYHDDIRRHGSGNAGATNMLRTYGKLAGAVTFLLDLLKSVVGVAFAYLILGGFFFGVPFGGIPVDDGAIVFSTNIMGTSVAGVFAVLGHMFPCFYKFKGGKGVVSGAAVILLTSPITFLVLLIVFIIVVAGTKFVSLGSIMCVLLYPVFLSSFKNSTGTNDGWSILCSFIIMGLVIFMHRENLKRLYHGEESKISFKKKNKQE